MSDDREKLIKIAMGEDCKEAAMICINSSASNWCDNKKIDLCVPFVILPRQKNRTYGKASMCNCKVELPSQALA